MNNLKTIILFLVLAVLAISCIYERFEFIWFNNRTEDSLYVVMQFNTESCSFSDGDYYDAIFFGSGKYQMIRFPPDRWEDHIRDSVDIYIASLDSLRKRYDPLDLQPDLIQEKDLLASFTIDGDILTTGDRTIHFHPIENSGIVVSYYNNYSPIVVVE